VPSLVAAYVRGITAVSRTVFYATALLMAIVVPVMLYEVTMRYVFNAPTVWGMETSTLLFGPYFMLGGAYVLHLRGHVAMDIVRNSLSDRADRIVELVNLPIIMAFCAILLWVSTPLAIDSYNYGETSFSAWNPPVWWVKASVPIALLLLLLQAVAEFLRVLFRDPTLERGTAL
jgi:TRAP-type mannitol/chloroaromatic compound transport system permease small subunit